MAFPEDPKAEIVNVESNGPETEKKDVMEEESTMEASGEAGSSSSSPKKRKADIHDPLDAGEGEEADDEAGGDDESGEESDEDIDVDEDDVSTEDCGSDWEVDSYDARNYDPDMLDEDCSDDELREQWRRYIRQIRLSKGFHVDPENVPKDLYIGVRPFRDLDAPYPPHDSVRSLMEKLVTLTFDKYNREKGTEVKMESVVRANMRLNYGPKYYITCTAKETPDGDPKEYQVKVERKFMGKGLKNHYILCRPAPQP